MGRGIVWAAGDALCELAIESSTRQQRVRLWWLNLGKPQNDHAGQGDLTEKIQT